MQHISEEDMVLLTALLDGALPSQAAEDVRMRIANDDALHEAYLDLLLIRDELAQLPVVRVPRSLRIDSATLHRSRGWRWWFVAPPGGLLTPAFGLVTSLVVAAFFVQSLVVPPMVPVSNMSMMAAPMVLEEVSGAESRMLESAPMSEDTAVMAESAPMSEDAAVMAEEKYGAPDASMQLDEMGYQQYGVVWFNWAIAGIVVSAIAMATSLRWLIQVWWRQRHSRS